MSGKFWKGLSIAFMAIGAVLVVWGFVARSQSEDGINGLAGDIQGQALIFSGAIMILIGIIDLVRSGGRIVEFKTTGQTPNPEKAQHIQELQCSCYAVMYREATGQTESAVELHSLVKTKTPKLVVTTLPAMTAKQETRLLKTVDSYLEGVQRRDWVPSPSPMACSCCEFFNECRRWS